MSDIAHWRCWIYSYIIFRTPENNEFQNIVMNILNLLMNKCHVWIWKAIWSWEYYTVEKMWLCGWVWYLILTSHQRISDYLLKISFTFPSLSQNFLSKGNFLQNGSADCESCNLIMPMSDYNILISVSFDFNKSEVGLVFTVYYSVE